MRFPIVEPIMLHFSSPFSNIAGANEYWKRRDKTTARISKTTERLRPVVCGDVEPRHTLQIEEAEEHAQYVTDKETAEDITLPIIDDSIVDDFHDAKKSFLLCWWLLFGEEDLVIRLDQYNKLKGW